MKALLERIVREPAMVTAVVLALVNTVWKVSADEAVHLATIIEAALVILAGKIVREQVTPVAAPNLPPSRRG
jgi:hypothetical protein